MKKVYLVVARDNNVCAPFSVERYPFQSFTKFYDLADAWRHCTSLHKEWDTVSTEIKELEEG